jgi:putative ABC transport system permease protein
MKAKDFLLAFRHIMRYRTYSFLNIFGLAIGMACAMLIMLWVNNELSVDKFHKNGKNIFIVLSHWKSTNDESSGVAITSPLAPTLNTEQDIGTAFRVTWQMDFIVRLGDKSSYEKGFYADSSFFRIMSYKLLKGDSTTALNNPNSIVISEKLAKKYFGKADPMGKMLTIRFDTYEEPFIVTGVLQDVTKKSSFEFECVMPFRKYEVYEKYFLHWGNYNLMTFVFRKPNISVPQLNHKIDKTLKKYDHWAVKNVTLFVQPFEDNYLYSDFGKTMKNPSGQIIYIKIFSLVALFIIFLACMNYTNLATALAIKRAKEVGIKKVFGSGRRKLIFQFTLEAIILSFIGFFLSLMMIECVLPYFNQLIGKEIVLDYKNFKELVGFLIVPVITGITAGLFPALYLSSYNPIVVLKSIYRPKKNSFQLRHVLVVIQFVITIAFIISSLVILKQIKYVQNKSLGLDKDNIIMFEQSIQIKKQRKSFKEEISKLPGVLNVTYTSDNPLNIGSNTGDPSWRGKNPEDVFAFPYISVDEDFIETVRAEIIAGRNFSTEYPTDTNCIIINQEAQKIMHFDDPIGEVVNYWGRKATIVGVVKNFHTSNLRRPIRQMMIICRPSETYLVMVKFRGDMRKTVLKNIEKVFRQYDESIPFECKFMDDEFAKNYKSEKYMSRFSNLFAILAIIISCLGLFGLALFTAEQKTKEIGIRKSIGAKSYQVVFLLAKDFLKWIAIAYIIACAIAYFALHAWLQNFAYRTDLSFWIFALTGIITFALAIITVSWQCYKAASKNPVESLRYE